MNRDRSVYLRHIRDCMTNIEEDTRDGREAFFADRKTRDAVVRNLEVIGQAVRDFGVDDLLVLAPTVPWKLIAGMRNVLAHQYFGVDMNLIWGVVERDIPILRRAVDDLLASGEER